MANDTTKILKGSTGNRYSPEKRKEILDFYHSQKDENGEIKRGAVKATQEKFNVSYIALRKWLEGSEEKVTKESKKKVGRPKGSSKAKAESQEPKQRGRKANPSIFAMRLLEKMKNQRERELATIQKAMDKISAK